MRADNDAVGEGTASGEEGVLDALNKSISNSNGKKETPP